MEVGTAGRQAGSVAFPHAECFTEWGARAGRKSSRSECDISMSHCSCHQPDCPAHPGHSQW